MFVKIYHTAYKSLYSTLVASGKKMSLVNY